MLNFESSNFFKNIWKIALVVKMAAKFEILSRYSKAKCQHDEKSQEKLIMEEKITQVKSLMTDIIQAGI